MQDNSKNKKYRSIKKKLSLTIIGLSICPLFLVCALLSWQSYRNQVQQVLNLEQEVVKRLSAEVTSFINSLEQELRSVIYIDDFHTKNLQAKENILINLRSFQRAFEELTYIDSTGQEIIHIARTSLFSPTELQDRSQTPPVLEMKKTLIPYFSQVKINTNIGVPMMTLAYPIIDKRSNRFIGSIIGEIRLKKIWDFIANIELNSGEFVYIIDASNKIIGHKNSSIVLKETTIKLPEADGVGKGLHSQQAIIAMKRISFGKQSFTIAAERHKGKAMAFAFNTMILVSVVLCIVFIIASIVGLSIVQKIVQPIRALAQTAHLIQEGDYKQKAPILRYDEIGELAQAFNSMTENLSNSLTSLQKEIHIRQKAENEVRELNDTLEQRVKDRTELLKRTQKEMVENAHKSGMADIANAVLHNVGNVLNSVIVSCQIIIETLRKSYVTKLIQANNILEEKIDNFDQFYKEDPKGKKLLHYYLLIGENLAKEQADIATHAQRLEEKTDIIKDIVISQQRYAKGVYHSEEIQLIEVIEDALRIVENSLHHNNIKVEKHLHETPNIPIQKTKLIYILINLFKNAKEAMMEIIPENRKIEISISDDNEYVICSIKDTGHGVAPENMNNIFAHGFTTKENGHGFGLHSCANYMQEMKGEIAVTSEGWGKGTEFILKFIKKERNQSQQNTGQALTTKSI